MITRALLLVGLLSVVAAAQDPIPEEAKQHLAAARQKAQQRDFKGAIESMEKALQIIPNHKGVWFDLGRLKYTVRDVDGAGKAFGRVIELDESFPPAWYMRGLARRQANDHEGALKDLSKAIELKNDYADAYLNRARLYEITGDLDGALKDFTKLTELAAEYGPGYLARAQIYSSMAQYDKAMEDYDNAMFLMEGAAQADVLLNRARTKLLQGKTEECLKDSKAAIDAAKGSHQTHFSFGLLLFDMGKYKEAIESLRKAIELGGEDSHEYGRFYIALSQYRLGQKDVAQKEMAAYLEKRKTKDDWFVKVGGFLAGRIAEKELLDAAQNENKQTTREQSLEAYWYAAALALANGDTAKAKQYMTTCVEIKIHNFIEYQSSVLALKGLEGKQPEK